tara:strand:- start:1984 stop:2208 length:225 start_codon:yes stop_codon:yes gene_type:complete
MKVMSRRNRDRNPREYIRIRINQLTEERDKCSDEMDKMWFNKIIAELSYVDKMIIDSVLEKSQEIQKLALKYGW